MQLYRVAADLYGGLPLTNVAEILVYVGPGGGVFWEQNFYREGKNFLPLDPLRYNDAILLSCCWSLLKASLDQCRYWFGS